MKKSVKVLIFTKRLNDCANESEKKNFKSNIERLVIISFHDLFIFTLIVIKMNKKLKKKLNE